CAGWGSWLEAEIVQRRAEVAGLRAVGPHHRQRDVVLHAGGRFRGEHVAGGFLEELQNRLVSNEGEFVTSTTTSAPASASASPSPVRVLTPEEGEADTA